MQDSSKLQSSLSNEREAVLAGGSKTALLHMGKSAKPASGAPMQAVTRGGKRGLANKDRKAKQEKETRV